VSLDDDKGRRGRREIKPGGGFAPVVGDNDAGRRRVVVDSRDQIGVP
jgi:hypothetical protein